jgi:hypothetical protein
MSYKRDSRPEKIIKKALFDFVQSFPNFAEMLPLTLSLSGRQKP